MANKLFRAEITGCDVHTMACAAADRIHAQRLIISRLKEYGLSEQQFTIKRLYRDKWCDWDLERTIIYN